MASQAFFYNAIFFTYALVLVTFYNLPAQKVGLYLFPFAIGNFAGPLFLGHLFDVIGRKKMITITYAMSGILLAVSGWMFQQGMLTATTQAIAWSVIFFLRVIRRQFGLSHGQRNFSSGDSRTRHRYLLCLRNAGRRSGCAVYLRIAHPERIPHSSALWISGRSRADDRRRCGRGVIGSGRGTEIVGVDHRPAIKGKAGA